MNVSGSVNVLVPCGSLGVGVRADEVRYGIAQGAHVIATDAGSTDSGAAYLALGISKNTREAVMADLTVLMSAQAERKIPLLIGTSGQAGGDAGVDWTRDIVVEVARKLGVKPRVAMLYSEQSKEELKRKHAQGKIRPLSPSPEIDDALIESCDHIVAVMGPEPYIAALKDGADIVVGGRTSDPAVLAALPLMLGAPPGVAWHAGKTGECGALCSADPTAGSGVLLRIDGGGFQVEALSPNNRCTPTSVSAHMLYENSNPFSLVEPGGQLDVREVQYASTDNRTVRVSGSKWEPKPYTMKLEGAATGKFQTLMLVGILDPEVLADADRFHDSLLAKLHERVGKVIGSAAGDYHLSLRMYGWNGVSGQPGSGGGHLPMEIGMMFVATASTQAMATRIAKACNPIFFHFPAKTGTELPSYGFPFSPAEVERGPVYEFRLNHVVEVDDPLELVRIGWVDLSHGASVLEESQHD
ncbi:acyclic terpene utilization AtuA family protein (plasmid) [Cupriavidus oxalaticus]|uniref:Acyclic terpene utilization AtuA family protein n=2 Tax=Cupriavidus oxalaticus TaxID=96344 RepID=A0A4P7LJZ9_9BURK|nr:acyclic terpene utilization AtuA family protein [Cupriavidus oxalaticus]